MASKYLQKFPVPDNFYEILHDFAREVIRDQPEDIIEYGASYFESLLQGKAYLYEGKYNIKRADQKIHKEYHPENQRKKGNEQAIAQKTIARQATDERVANKARPQSGKTPKGPTKGTGKGKEPERETSSRGNIMQRPSTDRDRERLHTETSHGTEKAAAHEYVNDLFNRSLKTAENEEGLEGSQEEMSGEFYVEIVNAKNLPVEETQAETYAVACLSHNPTTIMKTGNSLDAINPQWKHLDKFVVQINREEVYDISLVVQIFNFENGKTLVGEALMDPLEIFASPCNLNHVTLKLKNSDGEDGNFGEVSLLLSWVPSGEKAPEFQSAFSYF